ncbi:YgiQ family radical SAM protein [Anaerolineaceae bacterium oral taxon 439]|nr:YgiQ family radical SAM protein [Anaerolineaceae bacterium oral taxon 439]
MFLPTTAEEMQARGWRRPDVILVSGDTYIDSPYSGVALIGRILDNAGYKVAILAQPDIASEEDFTRLGEPALFWGVTGGLVDSMVSNYTALNKPRRQDDFTPGGVNNRRPDRAVLAYTNLIRRYFKNTVPIVLGGVEAGLRRVAHYDFWTNKVRGSILFDAKADYLLYGMADRSILQLAKALRDGKPVEAIRGLCYGAKEAPAGASILPSFEECRTDPDAFTRMFKTFYQNNDAVSGFILAQRHGERYLVQNPPAKPLNQRELDAVYDLQFERDVHPYYKRQGEVRALQTIRFSVPTHRGCYGECNYCAIAVHEGRTVQWRSEASILREIRTISELPDFKGYILDLGGPTANMYGYECPKKLVKGACRDRRCIYPAVCPSLPVNHQSQLTLLEKARKIPGVKKIMIASGIRYDLLPSDLVYGKAYLRDVIRYHVSGQLRVAPEHDSPKVLAAMGKPGKGALLTFKREFDRETKAAGLPQFLSYYFIACHPGCGERDMLGLKKFCDETLGVTPEQTQIFTPTPSTWSSLMYYTERDPESGEPIFVEKDPFRKQRQKDILLGKTGTSEPRGGAPGRRRTRTRGERDLNREGARGDRSERWRSAPARGDGKKADPAPETLEDGRRGSRSPSFRCNDRAPSEDGFPEKISRPP